jgi:hypothetical protein
MNQPSARPRPGDLVEVRTPDEIIQTLDTDGALDRLPFMPEMLEFCGQRFRVSRRALTACCSVPGWPLGFTADDIVTLDGVRCTGVAHDGCQKTCLIYWHEVWLRKVEDIAVQSELGLKGMDRLRARLKVVTAPNTYYCQASEFPKATRSLSRWERLGSYWRGLRAGNFNALQMIEGSATWLFWRIRRKLWGVYPRGSIKSTPVESLNLQPGEWVEVKSLESIAETLDAQGRNRGLHFSTDMRLWCGLRCRVKGRLDKIIMDGTGQMRQLRNTVYLEGITCGCSYMAIDMGGCSRCEVTYWREIWLRRCEAPTDRPASQDGG